MKMEEQVRNRIAVLSNVTMDLVTAKLKSDFDIYIPDGFNTWQQEVYDVGSGLYQWMPDAVFIILYADPYEGDWQKETGSERLGDWLSSIKFLREKMTQIPIFVSSLDMVESGCRVVSEKYYGTQMEADWIKAIEACDQVYILPLKEEAANLGRLHFYLRKMWYLGNAPFSLKGSEAVAGLIRRHFFYARGNKKKCFVVDLDNTLWGGVAGEDGADGIELASHREGRRYYEAQLCLKQMKENGVMLAVISKNNPEDVDPVFKNPDMVLKEEDFVGQKINWNPKPQNMRELAGELNIGLDAFVFLDDNPAEREEMKTQCPQVETLDFPEDTALLPQVIEEAYSRFFKPLYITSEDKGKTEQYRRQSKRLEAGKEAASVQDYLRKLEIRADIHLMRKEEKNRVIQLAGKTNQFNTTTIRYDERQIEQLQKGGSAEIIVGHMGDKFGEEGLTAVVVIVYQGEKALIESFMMSCRVMGREFEYVILDAIVRRIRRIHPQVKTLGAEYVKTEKNKPVESFYEKAGMDVKETKGEESAAGYIKRYEAEMDTLGEFVNSYEEVTVYDEGAE